jgi:hypothetical protein
MNLLPEQVKGSRDQAQHSGKQECRSNRFPGRKPNDQHQRGDGEAASTDSRQPDSSGDQESNYEVHFSACVEKV